MAYSIASILQALRVEHLPRPWVITLVGAGGKSTFMQRLAAEVQHLPLRALFTTTTRIWRHQFDALPHPVLAPTLEQAISLAKTATPGYPISIVSQEIPGEAKVRGVPAFWVDALAEGGWFDIIVVEGDGGREKPLKAPASHEPVVPVSTNLFISMAGWQGVGQPLTEEWVHHHERFARLAGLTPGAIITPQALAQVLTHMWGGLKGVPPETRVVWWLNQVDEEMNLAGAARLARYLIRANPLAAMEEIPLPPEVVISSLTRPLIHAVVGPVVAVVLAAGAGRRFGGPKQVALWQGRPLIHHVLDAVAASQVDRICVVVGAWREKVKAAVNAWQKAHKDDSRPFTIVENPDWAKGQSTSVRKALEAVGPVSAAVFLLADQPAVPGALIDALIWAHHRTLAPIVRPQYGTVPGSPVLFDLSLFGELAQLQGDTGGRAIIHRRPHDVHVVNWPDPTPLFEVDTPDDLLV